MLSNKSFLVLLMLFFVCGLTYSQTKKIEIETIETRPYDFNVNKIKFRFRIDQDNLILERYNATWITTDTLESLPPTIYLRDINSDGFIDFGLADKWMSETFLFNPILRKFVMSGFYSNAEFGDNLQTGAPHMVLLDSIRHMYFDYSTYKNGEWYSFLFQIKDFERIDIAEINNETLFSKSGNEFITTSILINKILDNEDNKKLVTKIKRGRTDKPFNYKKYWTDNWKLFINQ